MKPLVIIESPYAGDIEGNVDYAQRAMLDSIKRGEIPLASHLLYPQVLDDAEPEERALGISIGLAMYRYTPIVAFYIDRGWSNGMRNARNVAEALCLTIEERSLYQ